MQSLQSIFSKPLDVLAEQHGRMQYVAKTAAQLKRAAQLAGDAEAETVADFLLKTSRTENRYLTSYLQPDGTKAIQQAAALLFTSTRLDPDYVAYCKRRNLANVLRAVNHIFQNRRNVMPWFITLTMPKVAGLGFTETLAIINDAWTRFRKSRHWLKAMRHGGAVKAIEFTAGKQHERAGRPWSLAEDGYHWHLHLLVLSGWISLKELREVWTGCLKASAEEFGVKMNFIKVAEGEKSYESSYVNLQRISINRPSGRGAITLAAAVQRVCGYVVKGVTIPDGLPDSEVLNIFHALRGRHMLALLGGCREPCTGKRSECDSRSWANYVLNDYTKDEPHNASESKTQPRDKPKRRRVRRTPLLRIGTALIQRGEREKWYELLREEVKLRQEWRKRNLSERYPFAVFETFAGEVWFGLQASSTSLNTSKPKLAQKAYGNTKHIGGGSQSGASWS